MSCNCMKEEKLEQPKFKDRVYECVNQECPWRGAVKIESKHRDCLVGIDAECNWCGKKMTRLR